VVIEAEDYDAWGVAMTGRSYLSGVGAKEGYTGKERDAETGLDYFGARYYLGAIGRWGGVDALTDQYPSWSPYTYVLNSPLRLVDPDGREVVIKYEEDGEEKTYKYAPGTSYDGDNEFVKTVISYLNEVSTTEVTAFIINELVGSKNTFTIVSDVNSFFTPDNTRHANIGGFVTGSGGTLHFDMSGKPLFGANGRLDEPRPDSDLLHELSHALDANRGLNDNREINSEGVLYDATSSSGVHQSHQGFLRVAEWSATYRENQYRQERGYPLRGYYISTNRGVPMPPLMLRNGQPFIPTIRSN
jgi:RHS repeat-associated protein